MPKNLLNQENHPLLYLKRLLSFLAVFVVFFFAASVIFKVQSTQFTCANSKTCTSDLSEKIENSAVGLFQGKKIIPPKILSLTQSNQPVLGVSTQKEEKHIYVDLANQILYAFEGKSLFLKTFIASGKWGPTPVGNFHIWEKLISTRMAGGEGADAYDLPNVPYVMYFHNDFGLHGAYWHDNFGHAMSHGCVNMRQVDAKKLFEWTTAAEGNTLGTPVSICDTVTKNYQCIQTNPIE